jgi:hypothetical protein
MIGQIIQKRKKILLLPIVIRKRILIKIENNEEERNREI